MTFNVDQMIGLGRVSAVVPAPCGTWAAVAVARLDADRAKYVSDLWRVSLITPAVPAIQLTRGPSNDVSPGFRADGALGFLSNRNPRDGKPEDGDDERNQVWLLPAGRGDPRPLTDEPLGVSEFRFAAAGDRLIVVADVLPGVPHAEQRARATDLRKHGPSALRYRQMPVRYWDHWVALAAPHLIAYDGEGHDRRDLTPDADREYREGHWDLAIAGDRLVTTVNGVGEDRVNDRALRLIDCASGAATTVGAAARTQLEYPRLSPDGAHVACTRHTRRDDCWGPQQLWLVDAATGAGRALAPAFDRWLVPAAWTADGSAVVATADDAGAVPIFRVDVRSGEVTRISDPAAGGSHEGVHMVPGADVLVGVRHCLLHPPEPFRCELAPDATPVLCATLSGFTAADGAALARWQSFDVPSDDGVPVQTFLITPAERAADAPPLPLLLWIHGGPLSQFGDDWHWRWNPLCAVAAGYAVALANPRGSTGAGQVFIEGVWQRWGGECYRDLMAVTDALAARPDIDESRLAAMGGSFGGYMVNWIGGQTQRFRCLISHASIYWLTAFHGVTDDPAYFAHEMGGTPLDRREEYDRWSPHRQLAGWRTPTLIIHGEKDYRCPIGEGLALFEGLCARGVAAELLVFPDENHWVLKPRNIQAWYGNVLDFLGRHLH